MAAAMTDFTTEKSRLTGGQEFYGALLETFVAGELFKQQAWSQRRFRLFHLRERETEIDIVIELADGRLILVEVKSARDPDARAWRNLVLMQRKLGERVAAAVVLHQGSAAHTVAVETGKVTVLPVRSLWEHP